MRLLAPEDQELIWTSLANDEYLSQLPFSISRKNLITIDGNLEAYYAVIAANFIAGKIDENLV